MGNGDKDNDFADDRPTLLKLDASFTIDLDTAYSCVVSKLIP